MEARMIASRIRRLIAEQKVLDKKTGKLRPARYSDIVILTRSVKGIADIFVQELNREGIPAFSGTKEGYFATQEIGVLLDLSLIHILFENMENYWKRIIQKKVSRLRHMYLLIFIRKLLSTGNSYYVL